ncbi:MAG: cyclohydrolase [Mycobacteriales bacterium]
MASVGQRQEGPRVMSPSTRPPQAGVRARITVPLQVSDGVFVPADVITFHGLADRREHLAVVFGDALTQGRPLVRLHSECLTGDVLGSARCDCGPQLREAIGLMRTKGGVLLYLRQEGRGIGLYNKIDAYLLQDAGLDTFEANRSLHFADDQRSYEVAAQMLFALGLSEVDVLTNNLDKVDQLRSRGVRVHRQRLTGVHLTDANRAYLRAKSSLAGHTLTVE